MFGLKFVDGYALEEGVSEAQIVELMTRTPGYFAAQSEEWPMHCGDFCVLVGDATWPEVESLLSELESDLTALESKLEIDRSLLLADLEREHSPLWAYLFRCIMCGQPRLCADYE